MNGSKTLTDKSFPFFNFRLKECPWQLASRHLHCLNVLMFLRSWLTLEQCKVTLKIHLMWLRVTELQILPSCLVPKEGIYRRITVKRSEEYAEGDLKCFLMSNRNILNTSFFQIHLYTTFSIWKAIYYKIKVWNRSKWCIPRLGMSFIRLLLFYALK